MKLIACPTCQNPVSQMAASCPKCGHPIAGQKTKATTGLSAVVVLLGVVLTGVLWFALIGSMKNLVLAGALSVLPTVGAMIFASLRKR